jgi:hypothetical protein
MNKKYERMKLYLLKIYYFMPLPSLYNPITFEDPEREAILP